MASPRRRSLNCSAPSSGSKVSRYENFKRIPAVFAIFAYEVVFSQPVRELFAGSYQKIRFLVQARAKRLLKKLSARAPSKKAARLARKISLLRSIVEAKITGGPDREDV